MRFTARLILTALFCFAMDAVAPDDGVRAGWRHERHCRGQ